MENLEAIQVTLGILTRLARNGDENDDDEG